MHIMVCFIVRKCQSGWAEEVWSAVGVKFMFCMWLAGYRKSQEIYFGSLFIYFALMYKCSISLA